MLSLELIIILGVLFGAVAGAMVLTVLERSHVPMARTDTDKEAEAAQQAGRR